MSSAIPEEVGRAAVTGFAGLIEELPEDERKRALTHSSWAGKRVDSWGRLAFLGDSVLGLAVAGELFSRYPRSDIGRLTKIHGQAVSGRACAEVAEWLDVPDRLAGLEPVGLEGGIATAALVISERAMASITEALIGACYLHVDPNRTAVAVLEAFEPQIELAGGTLLDFKSALQERLARRGRTVSYKVVAEDGPPHDRVFQVEARSGGEVIGSGRGPSKKAAEQSAAEAALSAAEQDA